MLEWCADNVMRGQGGQERNAEQLHGAGLALAGMAGPAGGREFVG